MNINPVNILDGNKYLVSGNNGTVYAADFDGIYNKATAQLSLNEIFDKVSKETGVDVNLLKAVAKVESNFNPDSVSSSGAMGIMQLMPFTAESYGVDDPYDPLQNITGGAKLLAGLLNDYNGNVTLALAAYNAGSGAVNRSGGVPDTQQVQRYIKKVNDVLGQALSDDSTSIDGAEATVMNFPDVEVPDVSYSCYSVDQIKILEVIKYEGSARTAVERHLNASAQSLYQAAAGINPLLKGTD